MLHGREFEEMMRKWGEESARIGGVYDSAYNTGYQHGYKAAKRECESIIESLQSEIESLRAKRIFNSSKNK